MDDILLHYGIEKKSGRYPWGSGENPYQSDPFLSKYKRYKKDGLTEKQIAEKMGMNTTQLRTEIAWANHNEKQRLSYLVGKMSEEGHSNVSIARELGISEGSVRNYRSPKEVNLSKQLDVIKDTLEDTVNRLEYVDIGPGSELTMGISRKKLKDTAAKLQEEGYYIHEIYVRQIHNRDNWTTVKVLTKEPDVSVVKKNSDMISTPDMYTKDGGFKFEGLKPPKNVDWDRISINYGDEGGDDKDGIIEIRRGAEDLDLGSAHYAQVRIAVGGTHYLKGMAVYSDDLPPGVDIRFNTNKKTGTPKEDVLKELKDNDFNPFGATIKPGGQRGALNIVNEEGDWNKWSSTLSSQFLSKQPVSLVKERLDATYKKISNDYDEIMALDNPVVRRYLLNSDGGFAAELEAKAAHLKAIGLPRTKGKVILPYPDMKPNEVYAPDYKDGERVVLVRYPHGGTFELPELVVNNRGPAKKSLGNAIDGIGIHPSVASKLSGADFDGDTVYVIPNNHGKIKTSRTLKELKDFDPNIYKTDHKTISDRYKQIQMGMVSNLITDMTIKGATQSEIASAVRHSMVVIDSEKHKLDYKQSAIDNGINALKKKYQTHINPLTGKQSVGASTIISRSKRKVDIVNEKTGKTTKVGVFETVNDARKLSSGTAVENLYADYVNKVRALSNTAQKEALSIKNPPYKKEAALKYKAEVKSLDAKLNTALSNAPRERKAQILANSNYYNNVTEDMNKDDKKRLRTQSLAKARVAANAKKQIINITDNEWKAIQSGAISTDKLERILKNADMDRVKELATPKKRTVLTDAKKSKIKSLKSRGYTLSEIADAVGVSTSTINDVL